MGADRDECVVLCSATSLKNEMASLIPRHNRAFVPDFVENECA